MTNITELDSTRFYLGRLCKYGHDWNSTGHSLRRKDSRVCIQCRVELSSKYYYKNREKELKKSAQRYQKNKQAIRQRQAKHYREHKEDYIKRHSKYFRTPQRRATLRKYMAKFRQTPQGRASLKRANSRRKAYKFGNHHAYYSLKEIKSLKERFDNSCAYCGSTEILVLDHFIPVSKGGPDCLGNFIPSCRSCNTNKSNKNPIVWYKSQPFYSPKRWKLILEVLGKTESNYNQLPLL
ncbi:HNH endonuclease [Nostoc sp. UHCC 0702]|nr:HNH endonuclease [Nostoc sp. UHCC 0702]